MERREQELSIVNIGAMADRGAPDLGLIPQAPEIRRGGTPRGFGEGRKHLHTLDADQIKAIQTRLKSAMFFTSGALPADATREIYVLGEDRHALGMDGAEVGVLKYANKVSLRRLLQREDGRRLETEAGFEFLCEFADQALERKPVENIQLEEMQSKTDRQLSDTHITCETEARLTSGTCGSRAAPRCPGGNDGTSSASIRPGHPLYP
jgi:hypothetical protein